MNVKEIIKRHGFTQQEVAARMIGQTGRPVNPSSLAFSIGDNGNPTLGLLRQISDVIGANINEFFEDELPTMPQPTIPEFVDTITVMGKRYGLVPLDGD